MDAIQKLIEEVKKLSQRIQTLEDGGMDATQLKEQVDEIHEKLNRDPNFGDW